MVCGSLIFVFILVFFYEPSSRTAVFAIFTDSYVTLITNPNTSFQWY